MKNMQYFTILNNITKKKKKSQWIKHSGTEKKVLEVSSYQRSGKAEARSYSSNSRGISEFKAGVDQESKTDKPAIGVLPNGPDRY
jgi:hypothetical protein